MEPPSSAQVVIIGSGFSGFAVAAMLKKRGIDDFIILERAAELGGTWRDNHYPGCACDIPAHLYSFSFAPKSDWSQAYAPHQEIRAYLETCADQFDLRRHILFKRCAQQIVWNEADQSWKIRTSAGEEFNAQVVVSASGGLSNPAIPKFKSAERFAGAQFHSAQWDHSFDFRGKSVAVIGTGASAIQFIPEIQPLVGKLYVLQRTAPWVLPRRDRVFPRWVQWAFRYIPGLRWLYRQAIYWHLESFGFGFQRPRWMQLAAWIGKYNIKRSIRDLGLRAKLTPHYLPGCKRILLSNEYYPALAQSNVEVVSEPIESISEQSIELAGGRSLPVDAIIYGTGFAVHDYLGGSVIIGRDGKNLEKEWRAGAQAYLGTMVAGFPNLFIMTGPNTGLGHNSMVVMIEGQAGFVAEAIAQLHSRGLASIDAKSEVQQSYNRWLANKGAHTVWKSGCASWYLDEHGRNTTIWPGLASTFRLRLLRLRNRDFNWTPQLSATKKGGDL